MALLETAEVILSTQPDRLVMKVPNLDAKGARYMANQAVREARRKMPKATGASAANLQPIYGDGYFGIRFPDKYVWFQENGIRAFTMKSLAGKTIPMWIDDPTGQERMKNPKAKTRTTASGKTQVLIFRKAAKMGQRKDKTRINKSTGLKETYSTVASYPGAPGRISQREAANPRTTAGKVGGQIAKGNGGVRWRHPGLQARFFLNNSMTLAAQWNGVMPTRIYVADARWKAMAK